MREMLQPLRAASLKDVFIERLEELILSGKVSMGEKLPSERALALQLGVSRPVVHSGLVELAARGLVTLTPRVGAVVNDYRRQGSLALLNSLISYRRGALDPGARGRTGSAGRGNAPEARGPGLPAVKVSGNVGERSPDVRWA